MVSLACPGGVFSAGEAAAHAILAGDGAFRAWAIDGAVANSRAQFFAALAAALHFPPYFGHNWDATYDCLTDLAGGDDQPAVLLITNGERFLAGMGAEWTVGQRVFADAAAFWRDRGRLLLIVLASGSGLPGVPELPPSCLGHLLPRLTRDDEIALADERIRALNRSGRFEEALHAAQSLVSLYPDDPRAHFVLGGTFDFQDREAEAIPPYQRAWELGLAGDDVPRFYVQYGSTLRNAGQLDETVGILQEGHARFPDDAAIQAFLALALFSAGRAAEALATALSILAARPDAVDLRGYDRALREYIADLRPSDSPS